MIFIVQLVLVVAVIFVSLALMRGGSNARHLAIRRLMLVVFALAAAVSIFIPQILTSVANFLGIGRGTDLVLYALIICFFVFMSTTYQRFRQSESAVTRLARRIALDEAPRPWLSDDRARLAAPAPSAPADVVRDAQASPSGTVRR